jgi:hypothetical protein
MRRPPRFVSLRYSAARCVRLKPFAIALSQAPAGSWSAGYRARSRREVQASHATAPWGRAMYQPVVRAPAGGHFEFVDLTPLNPELLSACLAHGAFARRDAKAVSTSQTAGQVAKPAASFRKWRTLPGERDGHSLRSGGTLAQPTTRIEQWPTGPATTAST